MCVEDLGSDGLNLTEPGLRADFGAQSGMGTASALPSHLRAQRNPQSCFRLLPTGSHGKKSWRRGDAG